MVTPNAHDVTERMKIILLRYILGHLSRGEPRPDVSDPEFRRRAWRAARRLEVRRLERGDTTPLLSQSPKTARQSTAQRTCQHRGWRIVLCRNGGKWHAETARRRHPQLVLTARRPRRRDAFRAILAMIDRGDFGIRVPRPAQ
ncbi:hypothetical protein FW320_00460 [Azospirillum sp. Vi22]|uniref:hypothetical protein n=1 Tax=Azospirillum baldaniorum TaxID=1064539 RepID=UPI00157AA3EC|nr:hypothetical protein [Azospirillum baldaniorum]NUB04667.1 hypothetical protein [Azospirillum baldaniorum]